MSIKSTIKEQLEQIGSEQQIKLPSLNEDLVLLESGLDSLGFAILVARLEETLGLDPFTVPDEVEFPVTLGDLIRVYENAAKPVEVTA
jgi:acyl carrier protein